MKKRSSFILLGLLIFPIVVFCQTKGNSPYVGRWIGIDEPIVITIEAGKSGFIARFVDTSTGVPVLFAGYLKDGVLFLSSWQNAEAINTLAVLKTDSTMLFGSYLVKRDPD